jgi:hypothetical protein
MSAIVPQPWTFVQQGPPNHTLTLDGPNAPFGRPRRGAIAEQERELRASVTYYPGNRVPDRHIFGDKQTPVILSGRFMDSRIGTQGGALAKWDELDAFVADQVAVKIQWGGIYAASGLITKCKRSMESAEEFAWSLTFEVDSDDTKPVQAPVAPPVNTSDLSQQIIDEFANVQTGLTNVPNDIEFQPSFFDTITNLLQLINAPFAELKTFANSVDNYESTLSADVAHFRADVAQATQAITQLQITLTTAENDPAIVAARGPSQTAWYSTRAQAEESLLDILAVLAVMDLTAEVIQKGQPDVTYLACAGDTWESIAASQLGDASKADDLRQANDVRYGAQPTPGQVVHIPKTT